MSMLTFYIGCLGIIEVIVYEGNEKSADIITAEADLIFLLDFSDLRRIAPFTDSVRKSNAAKIMIDHHQDPDRDIAELIFSDTTACSTAQLVYEVMDAMGMTTYLNKEIAECLYVWYYDRHG